MFSSHNLSEVQHICDRVAIIDEGRLVAQDSPGKLSKELQMKPSLEITIPGLDGKVPEAIKEISGVYAAEVQDGTLLVTSDPEVRAQVIATLFRKGWR